MRRFNLRQINIKAIFALTAVVALSSLFLPSGFTHSVSLPSMNNGFAPPFSVGDRVEVFVDEQLVASEAKVVGYQEGPPRIAVVSVPAKAKLKMIWSGSENMSIVSSEWYRWEEFYGASSESPWKD